MSQRGDVGVRTVKARGMSFRVLHQGVGPRAALLLHGFPDHADSMIPLMGRLAAAGYRCFAPYMRGYGPSAPPPDATFYPADLARDAVAICEAVGLDDVVLIGHDWGALATYAACNLKPGRFARAVAISVPPARALLRNTLRHPSQLWRSAYIFYFQLPLLPELHLSRADLALIETLWRRWSPRWRVPEASLESVRGTFRMGDTVSSALNYYRSIMARGALSDPARYRESWRLVTTPITVPTLILAGAQDACIPVEMYAGAGASFQADWSVEVLAGGHFLPYEAPEELAARILAWRPD